MKTNKLILAIAFLLLSLDMYAQIRVVCVGNSVTEGYGLNNASVESWPAQLGVMLGNNYQVFNCGVSGTTMLKRGSYPYWNTSRFNDAKNYNPDILIIALGTNDAHPNNWQYKSDFYNDYADMIAQFRQNGRNPKIYVCYPVTCYGDNSQMSNLQNELIPIVSQISRDRNTSILDFNTPTRNSRNTLYNDNLHPNAAGARVVAKAAFDGITPRVPTFYQDCNYYGYGVKLGIGDYTANDLIARGISNDDISSIQVPQGYRVFAYVDDNFQGNYLTLTADNGCLGGWNDLFTSIRVRANGVTGLNGTYTIQNANSGKYMDVAAGSGADGANILQWTGHGAANQRFTLTDRGDGAYSLINAQSGKAMDVEGGSTSNVANVLQWTYSGNTNQRFIVLNAGGGNYKLKAAHSGRVVEVTGGGLNNGDNIIQYDDNNQLHGQWRLIAAANASAKVAAPALDEDMPAVVYPNPVSGDYITIKNVKGTQLLIADVSGKVMLKKQLDSSMDTYQLDVSSLKSGIYYVSVDGGEVMSVKIVRE
ncbi:RICIN domain-containing protein [Fulvivirga ligni]|uniref:RICIN domain-containing protein n=1 Tax=Fulvivirga ligni TaxID=2904246 RepID=UPI001F2B4D97|nr:RICIN domain-containing protein [Fulvivirga ligni]UII19619.1 RICIN domain-containing protein [Fulvivirga ligni]